MKNLTKFQKDVILTICKYLVLCIIFLIGVGIDTKEEITLYILLGVLCTFEICTAFKDKIDKE